MDIEEILRIRQEILNEVVAENFLGINRRNLGMLKFEAGPKRPNEKQYVCLSYVNDDGKEEKEFYSPKFYLEVSPKVGMIIIEEFDSGRSHIKGDK